MLSLVNMTLKDLKTYMEEHDESVVITSGGFDPIHKGHIEYLKLAKNISNKAKLICIANDDNFLKCKKGYNFYTIEDRIAILSAIKYVDYIIIAIDKDQTVCKTIEKIHEALKNTMCNKIIFAKGGDRNTNNIPEKIVCDKLGIEIVDGLGEKVQSSSSLVEALNKNKG